MGSVTNESPAQRSLVESTAPKQGECNVRALQPTKPKWSFCVRFTAFLLATMFLLSTGYGISQESIPESNGTNDKSETTMSLEELLQSNPTNRDYQTTLRCINRAAIRNHEILNQRMMVFTLLGKGRPKFLVQFGKTCHGLTRESTVNLESRGTTRICAGDWVRTETMEFGQRAWGPRCNIPGFEPITEHQLSTLKEAIITGRVK